MWYLADMKTHSQHKKVSLPKPKRKYIPRLVSGLLSENLLHSENYFA